jgi:hypothetical protein
MVGPFVAAMVVHVSSFLEFEQSGRHCAWVRIRIRSQELHLFHPSCELVESPPICSFRIACRHHALLDEANYEKVRISPVAGINVYYEQLRTRSSFERRRGPA